MLPRTGSREFWCFVALLVSGFLFSLWRLGSLALFDLDEGVAERARRILAEAAPVDAVSMVKQALSVWTKWLLMRPWVFGLTAYPVLRLKLALGKPLMDSPVGDELLQHFVGSNPRITRMSNLQAALGLLQLQ